MKRILPATFLALAVHCHAAISLTAANTTGVQSFATQPAATEWSTTSIAGAAGDYTTAAQVDAGSQTLAATAITTQLGAQAVPGTNAQGRYSGSGATGLIYTASTGVRASFVMATLQNDSGSPLAAVTITYDHTRNGTAVTEEVMGHRVYYSLTGLANSWTAIPALSGISTNQTLATTVSLSAAWAGGAKLYLLWADDNGSASPDTGFTIDNFSVAAGNPSPAVAITAPASGSTATAPGAFTITANASDNGSVTQVEFLRNGTVIHTDTTAPYSFADSGLATGNHSYTARATDNLGAATTSAAVAVAVFTDSTNTALQFDGVNDYVTMGQATGTLGTATFTIECWFKRTGTGVSTGTGSNGLLSAIPLVTKGKSQSDNSVVDCNYFLGIDTATNRICADFEATLSTPLNGTGGANNNYPVFGSTVIANNVWTHAAATWDGSAWKLVVNGVEETVTSPNTLPSPAPVPRFDSTQHFGIGTAIDATPTPAGFFQGVIDEARVWSIARTPSEIAVGKDSPIATPTTGLLARYGMNEGSGTSTANSARVDTLPAGVLTNGPLWVDGVTFTPNDPPAVVLTAPATGSSFVAPTSVSLTADATDSDGTVSKVEFLQGATKLGEDTTAPYEYLWAVPNAAASYFVTAVATDNRGRTAASTASSITVTLPPNVAPTITLTAPADGANFFFPATINLTATAADADGNLAKVEFYRGAVKLGEDTTAPFEYVWTNAAVGSHSITAVAIDTFNATTTTAVAAITVTLPPNDPPSVTLDSPASGSNFVFPATINLAATATDPNGNLSKVQFYQGTTLLGEDTTAPFEYAWTNAPIGSHVLTAKAIDSQNATTTSNAANINVNLSSNVPPAVTLSAPADNSTGIGTSTTLTVNIADPEGDAQTVTFYGRKRAPLVPGPDFTLGTLPDTQFYSQNTGGNRAATFYQQTQWFVDNRDSLNLAFVSHMGDMVQDNDSIDQQWVVASTAMGSIENQPATLRAYGIPWGGAPGNHDVAGSGSGGGNAVNAKWNQYFGNSRWAGKPYYRGSYSPASSGSNYQFFSASGLDFIIIHLEYMTSGNQAVLDWADALLKANPHRRAIVTSHWILNTPPTSPVPAQAPFGGPGQAIYDNLKDNPNLFLTLCGHIHNEGRRADVYQGRTVHSCLQDYQDRANGGDGWLRYFIFSPANGTIRAKTYSPKLGIYETNADNVQSPADTQLNEASEFTLAYDMQGSASDWIPLGTAIVAANGTSASLAWTGLEKSSAYEWYASSNDGTNNAGSSVGKFATATAAAPTVAITSPATNDNVGLPAAVNITATAADSDGTVAKVAFFSGSTLLNEDTVAPYEYAWSAPSGNYVLTAIATDNEGNATLSNVVSFNVSNAANILPTVTLTSPSDGASVEAGTISLAATAADTDGTIAKVEFFNGATKVGEDLTSPYTYEWPGVVVGNYTLTAKATDNDSGAATSAAATITVTPAGLFVASYFQNFDGMGTTGTTRRPAWTSWNGAAGSVKTDWTTSIPAAGVAAMTESTGPLVASTPPTATNKIGVNGGISATPADRQFASSPTGEAGVAHQLQLTNASGGPITTLNIAYDIRRYNTTTSANELPGYWLFYSLDGSTWTNVAVLNPNAAAIPHTSTGVTSIPATNFTLAGPWNNNAVLLLRWVDDNGDPTSPDQIYGLDNVAIHAGVNSASALTATPVVNGDGVALAWTDNSENETGFRIERKLAADSVWNLLVNTPANAAGHADATAGPGVSFEYRVVGFNASVTGTPSNIASAAAYTALQDWKLATQGNANHPANSDNDNVSDLFEFAFGLNPMINDAGPVVVDVAQGILTTRGEPAIWYQATGNGTDFRVIFIRRKDHIAAGLTYSAEFSGDMTDWEPSNVIPTVIADGGEVEAVSIKYPFFAAGKKARFFRIGVSSNQ